MNREERYTTVTLTINGESARRTLEVLTAQANALGEQISALRSGERSAESGEAGNASGVVKDTAAEVRRL